MSKSSKFSKPSNPEKASARKRFKQALNQELHEHRSSFIAFTILRFLVIVTMIRQGFQGNYESVFFCALTILLLYVPSWVQVRMKIELPPVLEITILCFIFAAEILGEVHAFYIHIQGWDTMLHTLNGFLAAAVGFSLVVILNDDERLTFDLSPAFMAMMAFCFSMTVGVLWEFFEFGMDYFFRMDMQKDTVLNAIYTVTLDPTSSNKVVAIQGIEEVLINGEDLGVGGYLDIGLYDTMKDMFVNFIGAAFFSVFGFIYVKTKGQRRSMAQSFVPTPKTPETDYLRQAILADEESQKQLEAPHEQDNPPQQDSTQS